MAQCHSKGYLVPSALDVPTATGTLSLTGSDVVTCLGFLVYNNRQMTPTAQGPVTAVIFKQQTPKQ